MSRDYHWVRKSLKSWPKVKRAVRTGSQVTSGSVIAADGLVFLINNDWIYDFAEFILTSANELK